MDRKQSELWVLQHHRPRSPARADNVQVSLPVRKATPVEDESGEEDGISANSVVGWIDK